MIGFAGLQNSSTKKEGDGENLKTFQNFYIRGFVFIFN